MFGKPCFREFENVFFRYLTKSMYSVLSCYAICVFSGLKNSIKFEMLQHVQDAYLCILRKNIKLQANTTCALACNFLFFLRIRP